MIRSILINIIAIFLLASFVGELGASLHYADMISVEMDGDGEEKEQKEEDKLKELIVYLPFIPEHTMSVCSFSNIYFLNSWSMPPIDNLTPPPQLV